MNEINLNNWIQLPRTFFYIWATAECFLLAYLYHFGYDKIKKTAIIGALKWFFVNLGAFFLYLCFLPLAKFFQSDGYDLLVIFIMVPTIGVIISLRSFRFWTLNQGKKR